MAHLSKVLLLLLFPVSLFGQNIPIETWRNHFSYSNIQHITSSDRSIICAADNGLFFVNKQDLSINLISKLDGLSDVGASDIEFDRATGSLVIGYPSGLIDIYRDNQTITVSAIYESLLVGDKFIKDIEIRDRKIFASNGFGIIVINLDNGEVIENFQSIGEGAIDVESYETASSAKYLVANTSEGLQFGPLTDNLLDFNNWTFLDDSQNSYSDIQFIGEGEIAVIVNDTSIYTYTLESTEKRTSYTSSRIINDLEMVDNKLHVLIDNAIYLLTDGSLEHIKTIDQKINSIYYDGDIWYGSATYGLLDESLQTLQPNGPMGDSITKIRLVDGKLYALFGPDVESYESGNDLLGYNLFDNSQWTYHALENFDNLTDIASFQGELFLASASNGLLNLTTGEKVPIAASSQTDLVTISSISASKNLYIACYDHQTPLITLTEEGTLTTYESDYVITDLPVDLNISERETIWITRSTTDGGGIIALELVDDQYRVINSADGLSSNQVNDIAISLSDESWVGTRSGLASFSEASFIFDESSAIPAFYDGEELFSGMNVTSVEVDGGNRLWVGTENQGIWVFNSNFSSVDYRFTFLNSPLPSNNVRELAYNSANGEMYILTDKGLSSFRSNSSVGNSFHQQVNIFPNPVRPGYSGKVGVSGLVNNANVKITDVNGKLVRELNANGGSISWDLLDYNNHRVNSGIYVLFSSNVSGEETYIGKLAVVNE